jgi:hypothetical protein
MLPISLRLSPLAGLPDFLNQHALANQDLNDALVDGLENDEQGADVVMDALRAALDGWLYEAREQQYRTPQFTNPFEYLAIVDHIAVVEAFRELL